MSLIVLAKERHVLWLLHETLSLVTYTEEVATSGQEADIDIVFVAFDRPGGDQCARGRTNGKGHTAFERMRYGQYRRYRVGVNGE